MAVSRLDIADIDRSDCPSAHSFSSDAVDVLTRANPSVRNRSVRECRCLARQEWKVRGPGNMRHRVVVSFCTTIRMTELRMAISLDASLQYFASETDTEKIGGLHNHRRAGFVGLATRRSLIRGECERNHPAPVLVSYPSKSFQAVLSRQNSAICYPAVTPQGFGDLGYLAKSLICMVRPARLELATF